MALYRHEFAMCPWCNRQSGGRVDHLYGGALPREFGSWYCDECGSPFSGKVFAPGSVEIWKDEKRNAFTRSMVLLRFEGKDGPTFFIMDHKRYQRPDDTPESIQSSAQYFFEEHSCPTNWIDECAAVIQNGDCDPHGFLEFVRSVDVPADFDDNGDEQWPILFPEAFDGDVIEGTATDINATKRIA